MELLEQPRGFKACKSQCSGIQLQVFYRHMSHGVNCRQPKYNIDTHITHSRRHNYTGSIAVFLNVGGQNQSSVKRKPGSQNGEKAASSKDPIFVGWIRTPCLGDP